jgi:putative RecB family exonuclease
MIAQPPPVSVSLPQVSSLPDHLSWSQVSTMRACPQKFLYSYIARPPKDFIASSMKFGSAVHTGLEHFFRSRMEGAKVDHQAMLEAYQNAWQQEDEPGVRVKSSASRNHSVPR